MSRIETLNQRQRDAMPAYRRKWLDAGLSTESLDEAKLARAIAQLYAWMQFEPPGIVWCKSPHEAMKLCLRGGEQPGAFIADRIRVETAGETLGDLAPHVWNEMAGGLRIPVSSAVIDRITEPLANHVLSGAASRAGRNAMIGGLFDCHNAAFYDFARHELGLADETEGAARLMDVAGLASWVIPCRKVCFVTRRPTALRRDDQGRLHSADRAAVAWPDRQRIYAWKGIFVPKDVILEPEAITAERVDEERNAEVRRCLIERMGAERYFQSAGAQLVHEDRTGRLWHKTFVTRDVWAVVEVVNGTDEPDGTRKHYYLHVPPRCRTAREAVAWTYGLREAEYELMVRT